MKLNWPSLFVVVLAAGCGAGAADESSDTQSYASEAVQVGQPIIEVSNAARQDVSPALHTLPVQSPHATEPHDHPLRLIQPNQVLPHQPDPALQTTPTGDVVATTGLNFDGLGNGFVGPAGAFSLRFAPPDTTAAVGDTQYVQWVNDQFAVFNKTTGAPVFGPAPGSTLWQGFGGPCETNNDGDPIVQYDKAANRWVLTQFSVSTQPFFQCVAVSTTSDATGSYFRYAFEQPLFPDYPKVGIWPDAYYVSFNTFSSNFQGGRVCAFDRQKMLTGAPATQQCVQLSTAFGGLLPADVDGSIAPPAGAPNYVVNFGTNKLNVFLFHVDFANSANTTFTGPASVPVAAFSSACNGGACIPQPGTKQKLDSLADRLMYRLAYRHFADGHEALVVNHSVSTGTTGGSGIRWYELRVGANNALSLFQQGTFSPDSASRWMGSIAMDKVGNIAVGYSVSSSSIFPGIRYTGRAPTDPLGTLQAESTIFNGSGSQQRTLSRWGDYSSMSIDPIDDCTLWYSTEYLKGNGTFNWSTRVATIHFPNCQ